MKNDKLPREAECKRTGARFNELLQPLFRYAERKGHVDLPFAEYFALADEWEQYPEGWEGNVLGMLAGQSVAGNRKRAAAFCRASEKELTDSQLTIARRWKKLPWFFTAFTVVESYGDGLLEIAPLGDPPANWPGDEPWDSLLLYSRTVTDRYRHGTRLFLAQLWKGEHAFHTYGVILDLPTMEPEDLFFFADIEAHLDSEPGEVPLLGLSSRTTRISESIARAPLFYLQLLRYTQAPRVTNRHGEFTGTFSATAPLRAGASSAVASGPVGSGAAPWSEAGLKSSIEAAGHAVDEVILAEEAGAVFLGEGHPMLDGDVYLSFSSGLAYLTAASLEAYQRGREAVAVLWSFPEEPGVRATMPALLAARGIIDYEDELAQLQELFGERRGVPGGDERLEEELEEPDTDSRLPSMEELQSILARLMENQNEGRSESDEEVAAAVGVVTEMVAPVRAQVDQMLQRQEQHAGEAADRFGLSPRAFYELSHGGVPKAEGALVLRAEEEVRRAASSPAYLEDTLDRALAYRFCRWLLDKAARDGGLPVTQAGYVGTKVVAEAFEARLLPVYFGEPIPGAEPERWEIPKKESDWPVFEYLRELLEGAGLLSYKGKKFVASGGAAELVSSPADLYLHLLRKMFSRFPWDDHPRFQPLPLLREEAGFLFYAAGKLQEEAGPDSWVPAGELADRFIAAAPPVAAAIAREAEERASKPRLPVSMGLKEYVASQVQASFIFRFAWPMGLLELSHTADYQLVFRVTHLFELVFRR